MPGRFIDSRQNRDLALHSIDGVAAALSDFDPFRALGHQSVRLDDRLDPIEHTHVLADVFAREHEVHRAVQRRPHPERMGRGVLDEVEHRLRVLVIEIQHGGRSRWSPRATTTGSSTAGRRISAGDG
jgi:hypothetical protein